MSAKLNGTWVLEKTENFEEFMKEYGLNIVLRKIGAALKPTIIISNEGNKWLIKTLSTFKNEDDDFVLDEEVEKVTLDGRKARIKRKLEGEKLVGEQRDIKTNALHVIGIKFVNEEDKMIEELICGKVKSIRIFKRVH